MNYSVCCVQYEQTQNEYIVNRETSVTIDLIRCKNHKGKSLPHKIIGSKVTHRCFGKLYITSNESRHCWRFIEINFAIMKRQKQFILLTHFLGIMLTCKSLTAKSNRIQYRHLYGKIEILLRPLL